MIWLWLILAAVIAAPLFIEYRRRVMDDVARGSAPGQFVELSNGVTHFQWFGPERGPVVVCVHGLTTPSFVWRSIARALAGAGYRVLTYDLYGRGYSDRPRGKQDRVFFIQQLTELLAVEGVEDDLTLVGYSMGGAIATTFAATYPARMKRLILLAPAGMVPKNGGLLGFIKRTPGVGDWLFLALYPRMQRKGIRAEERLPTSVPNITRLQAAELENRGYLRAILASLRGILSDRLEAQHRKIAAHGIPVLAIWGREDRVIPATSVGALAEWNRHAQHETIEGAGHGLTYTHTDAVLRHMRGFMETPADRLD